MNEMSLDEQIARMQEMKDYLDEFCVIMRNVMDIMQNQIKYLRSVGLSVETEEAYQQRYFIPANNDVEQVITDIRNGHFRYIDDVIESLESAKNR